MKVLAIFLISSFFMFSAFASDVKTDSVCTEDQKECQALEQDEANFYNANISEDQTDNAFALADDMLGNIGRSIAGEFEQ